MKKLKIFIAMFMATSLFLSGCSNAEPEVENKNNVESKQITPTSKKLVDEKLIIWTSPEKYSYENLVQDIQTIKNVCPQVQVNEIATTADGRKVYDIVLGDLNSQNQILIFGAMHAREYITVQTVMRQLCNAIDASNGYGENYRGVSATELLQGVTIHFIPNSNPDGVAISQFGLNALQNENIRSQVAQMGGNFVHWKANANGVDLNRNFDAGWQEFQGSPYPSSERYKGKFPGSEPEAAALIKLMQDYPIKRTISYHTCGALIYWYYKQEGAVLTESQKFANAISHETGYPLDGDYTSVDAAGFKDWAVYKLGVPSITIETGAESGGIVYVVPQSRFNGIWQRNKNVVYATIYNLKYEYKIF